MRLILRKDRIEQQRVLLFIEVLTNQDLFPTFTKTLTEMNFSTHSMITHSNTLTSLSCDTSLYFQSFLHIQDLQGDFDGGNHVGLFFLYPSALTINLSFLDWVVNSMCHNSTHQKSEPLD